MQDLFKTSLSATQETITETIEKGLQQWGRKDPYENAKEEFQDYKKQFDPTDEQERMYNENIYHRRADGTCKWIFHNPKFEMWLSSPKNEVLWIAGKASKLPYCYTPCHYRFLITLKRFWKVYHLIYCD
jgi:hypothetical protein